MPKQRKQRVSRAASSLDWQFPDEEAWLAKQANGSALPTQPRSQRRGVTEQRILLLLLILVSLVYWLWSAGNREEGSSTALFITQGSPPDSVEDNVPPAFSSDQQRKQAPLLPTTADAKDRASDATPSSQPEPICFWSHIACNDNP